MLLSLSRAQRGFTLIELMIAVVLMGIVGTVMYRMLVNTQRLTTAQTEQASLQSNVRTGVLAIPSELREIDPAGADLVVMNPTQIQYRAMRSYGIAVNSVTTTEIFLCALDGLRDLVGGRDWLLIFAEGPSTTTDADDTWEMAGIASTSASTTACPGGGTALRVTLSPALSAAQVALITTQLPAPVRAFEVMEIASYKPASSTRWWVGARSVSAGESMEPVLGPLVDSAGLRFRYYDAAGAEITAAPTTVRSIGIEIQGATAGRVHGTGGGSPQYAADTMITRVALRNAP